MDQSFAPGFHSVLLFSLSLACTPPRYHFWAFRIYKTPIGRSARPSPKERKKKNMTSVPFQSVIGFGSIMKYNIDPNKREALPTPRVRMSNQCRCNFLDAGITNFAY